METHFCRSDSVGSNSRKFCFTTEGTETQRKRKPPGMVTDLAKSNKSNNQVFVGADLSKIRLVFVFLCACVSSVVREKLRAVAVALHHAQKRVPGSHRFAIL